MRRERARVNTHSSRRVETLPCHIAAAAYEQGIEAGMTHVVDHVNAAMQNAQEESPDEQ